MANEMQPRTTMSSMAEGRMKDSRMGIMAKRKLMKKKMKVMMDGKGGCGKKHY